MAQLGRAAQGARGLAWRSIYVEDTAFLEVKEALTAVLWGFWLAARWWSAFAASHSFHIMALIAPEWVWGVGLGWAGLAWMVAIYYRWIRARRLLCAGLFLFWVFASLTCIVGNFPATTSVIYATVAMGHAWTFWRLGLQERRLA